MANQPPAEKRAKLDGVGTGQGDLDSWGDDDDFTFTEAEFKAIDEATELVRATGRPQTFVHELQDVQPGKKFVLQEVSQPDTAAAPATHIAPLPIHPTDEAKARKYQELENQIRKLEQELEYKNGEVNVLRFSKCQAEKERNKALEEKQVLLRKHEEEVHRLKTEAEDTSKKLNAQLCFMEQEKLQAYEAAEKVKNLDTSASYNQIAADTSPRKVLNRSAAAGKGFMTKGDFFDTTGRVGKVSHLHPDTSTPLPPVCADASVEPMDESHDRISQPAPPQPPPAEPSQPSRRNPHRRFWLTNYLQDGELLARIRFRLNNVDYSDDWVNWIDEEASLPYKSQSSGIAAQLGHMDV